MKDMKVIITRAMLAFIAFIVIIIKDEDRMIEYVLENYELKNGDEIKKIKIVEFKKTDQVEPGL